MNAARLLGQRAGGRLGRAEAALVSSDSSDRGRQDGCVVEEPASMQLNYLGHGLDEACGVKVVASVNSDGEQAFSARSRP